MTVELFKKPLTTSFVPSAPLLLVGSVIVIDFEIVVTTNPTDVQFYFEFEGDEASDPNDAATLWYREVAEEDVGSGVVNMPIVIRGFKLNGGAALSVGTHRFNVQFVRDPGAKFGRIQAAIVAGGGAATMTALARTGQPALATS